MNNRKRMIELRFRPGTAFPGGFFVPEQNAQIFLPSRRFVPPKVVDSFKCICYNNKDVKSGVE
jgi:hypothetical protein